ncbi:hypothetical protein [Nocardia sp. NPDC046763]|uniref:hypothetical protein n=1 Tax=Nocardia sp. NPDC046763 TaxID=3155256 RepID=UPI0033CF55BF
MFLRRFDIERTFRMLKQTLGWTRPQFRRPEGVVRWTWITLVAYTQLDWPGQWTPTFGGRGRNPLSHNDLPLHGSGEGFGTSVRGPALQPVRKPTRPGPGRPPGSRNHHRAHRTDVGRILATGRAYARRAHHKNGTKPRRTG